MQGVIGFFEKGTKGLGHNLIDLKLMIGLGVNVAQCFVYVVVHVFNLKRYGLLLVGMELRVHGGEKREQREKSDQPFILVKDMIKLYNPTILSFVYLFTVLRVMGFEFGRFNHFDALAQFLYFLILELHKLLNNKTSIKYLPFIIQFI
jgi:hypothetical protein